jgi:hypothetical protein
VAEGAAPCGLGLRVGAAVEQVHTVMRLTDPDRILPPYDALGRPTNGR